VLAGVQNTDLLGVLLTLGEPRLLDFWSNVAKADVLAELEVSVMRLLYSTNICEAARILRGRREDRALRPSETFLGETGSDGNDGSVLVDAAKP